MFHILAISAVNNVLYDIYANIVQLIRRWPNKAEFKEFLKDSTHSNLHIQICIWRNFFFEMQKKNWKRATEMIESEVKRFEKRTTHDETALTAGNNNSGGFEWQW